jgi:hypothetical protein
VWVSRTVTHTKHQKKRKLDEAVFETDSKVHLPAESDQGPALPKKAVEWPLGQTRETKEAMLQVVAVLWRQMVVAMKKIQNRHW